LDDWLGLEGIHRPGARLRLHGRFVQHIKLLRFPARGKAGLAEEIFGKSIGGYTTDEKHTE